MRFPCLHLLVAASAAAGLCRASISDARVEALFRPAIGEVMALSPDGNRLAYTTETDGKLAIVIIHLEQREKKRSVPVEFPRPSGAAEEADPGPARLRFLRWATPNRLVYAPVERIVPLPPVVDSAGRVTPHPDGPTILSPILVLDVDGKERGTVVDARDFQETPASARRSFADLLRTNKELEVTRREPVHWKMPHLDILGFLPRDRAQLLIGTHGAYSMPLVHTVDLRTGEVHEYGDEWPAPPGDPLVFDWFRHQTVGERLSAPRPAVRWRDEDLARVQRSLETKFPRRIVELLDWSDNHARVLFRVTGGSDPGRIFLFHRPEDLALELFRRAPWLTADKLHPTHWFDLPAAEGTRLSGYFTRPAKAPAAPPVIVVFPSTMAARPLPPFDAEAQVLADLGFAVVRLHPRTPAGGQSTSPARLPVDADVRAVTDAQAALAALAERHGAEAFDARRAVAFGRDFGGYLALRALQLQPDAFHCGITIDAPADLRAWLRTAPPAAAGPAATPTLADHDWSGPSVLAEARALTAPVLLMTEPRRNLAVDHATAELRATLRQLGRTHEHAEIAARTAAPRPEARAAVYRTVENFLNAHVTHRAASGGAQPSAP